MAKEKLSDPIHTLHMRLTNDSNEVRIIKALREARKTLGDLLGAGLDQSIGAIRDTAGPVLVGIHTDKDLIIEAANQISDLSRGQAIPVIDWDGDLTDEDEDDMLGHQVALVLMGLTDGKPVDALVGAFNLRMILGDDIYTAAMDALIGAYPALEDVAASNDLL